MIICYITHTHISENKWESTTTNAFRLDRVSKLRSWKGDHEREQIHLTKIINLKDCKVKVIFTCELRIRDRLFSSIADNNTDK